MSKPERRCSVPGCKGRLLLGGSVEWCVACERRMAQLEVVRRQLAEATASRSAPAVSPLVLDEAAIAAAVRDRFVVVSQAPQFCRKAGLRRGANAIGRAWRAGEIVVLDVGRMQLLGRESLLAWARAFKPRTPANVKSLEVRMALPRSKASAIPIGVWAQRAARSPGAIAQWLRKNRDVDELQSTPLRHRRGGYVVGYWWKEAKEAEVGHA